jgi:hypothetical protein
MSQDAVYLKERGSAKVVDDVASGFNVQVDPAVTELGMTTSVNVSNTDSSNSQSASSPLPLSSPPLASPLPPPSLGAQDVAARVKWKAKF